MISMNRPSPLGPTYWQWIAGPLEAPIVSLCPSTSPKYVLTGIIGFVAVLLAFVESSILLLLVDVELGDVLLVSRLVD